MTLGMQVRAWAREASRGQVWTVAAVVAVALGLMAASLAPASRSGDDVAAGFGDQSSLGSADGQGSAGAAGDMNGSGPGGVAGASGAGVAGGGASSPGSAAGGAGSGAGGGGSSPTTPVVRTKSDVGVTESTIKVAAAIINIGPIAQAGYAVGLRQDMEQVIDAFADDINDRGGIAGRKLEVVKRRVDAVSESDQQAACTEFADDKKVFAVLDTVGFFYETTQRCLTYDKKVPLIHLAALTEELQNGARGYDISPMHNFNRIAREWGQAAVDSGWLRGGETVGVLDQDCDPVITKALVPIIQRANPKRIVVRHDPCRRPADAATVTSDVLAFYNEGVTHVIHASGAGNLAQFTKVAESQRPAGRERFKYFVSQYSAMTDPNSEGLYDPNQFDGTPALGTGPPAHPMPGPNPLDKATKRCSDILTARGLPGAKYDAANGEALSMCDNFRVLSLAMAHAGPNPTRAAFAAGVGRVGQWESALNPMTAFTPGKYSAADGVIDLRWTRECNCFRQVSGWRKGRH